MRRHREKMAWRGRQSKEKYSSGETRLEAWQELKVSPSAPSSGFCLPRGGQVQPLPNLLRIMGQSILGGCLGVVLPLPHKICVLCQPHSLLVTVTLPQSQAWTPLLHIPKSIIPSWGGSIQQKQGNGQTVGRCARRHRA